MKLKVNYNHKTVFNTLIFGAYFLYFAIFRYFMIPSADDYFWYGDKGSYLFHHLFYGPQAIYGGSSNGRYLGNIFEIVTIRHLFIAMIIFSFFWTLLIWCIWRLSNSSKMGLWLSFLFVFTLQNAFLNNLLVWNAGFVNYVPPIALLLLYLVILFNKLDFPYKKIFSIFTFFLGLSTGLFMESITTVQVILSIAVFICLRKKTTIEHITYFIGSIISALVMFLHPSYREPQAYKVTTTNFIDIWRIYSDMTHFWLITFNLFLIVILLISISILFIRSDFQKKIKIPMLSLSGFFLFYYIFINFKLRNVPMNYSYMFNELNKNISNLDAIISLVFIVFVGLCIGLLFKNDWKLWSFYLLAGIFMGGMLLVASPINSRPFLFPYVFMYLIGMKFLLSAISHIKFARYWVHLILATAVVSFSINHQYKMFSNYHFNLDRVNLETGEMLKNHVPHRKFVYVNDDFEQLSGIYWQNLFNKK